MGVCSSQSNRKPKNANQLDFQREIIHSYANLQSPQQNNDVQKEDSFKQDAKVELKSNEQIQKVEEKVNNVEEYQMKDQKENEKLVQFEQENQINVDVDAKMGEISEQLELELIPRQNKVQVLPNSQILLPCIAKVKINTLELNHKTQRNNMDLICVVDISGSMDGEKLQNVQDSLRHLQKILSPEDQFAIVSFDNDSYLTLDWIFNSPKNKKQIKKRIIKLQTSGSTNIASGFELCLQTILSRKYKNPVCNIFLLTDGQDDENDLVGRCQNIMDKYQIQETIVMHTFGYGQDHNANDLNALAELTGGKFVYIQEIEKAAENFILCLSGMLSIVATDVQLQINEISPYCKVSKTYGNWKMSKEQSNQYNQNIVHLGQNEEKIIIFELEIHQDKQYDEKVLIKASISGTIIKFKKPFFKEQSLVLEFTSKPVQLEQSEFFEVNYMKAVAGEKIGEAMGLARQLNYDKAQQILKKIEFDVETSAFKDNQKLIRLKNDLVEAREMCKPQIQQFDRDALMLQKQRKHIQQEASLNDSLGWNSEQEENIEQVRNGNADLSYTYGMNSANNLSGSFRQIQVLEEQSDSQCNRSQNNIDSNYSVDSENRNVRVVQLDAKFKYDLDYNTDKQKLEKSFAQSQASEKSMS